MNDDLPDEVRLHAGRINFDSTISRRLVHRNYIDHVLVTDLVKLDEDRFLCGARLPQSHVYFNETSEAARSSGILLAAETMRQSCIALSHKYLEISPEFSYILQRASCTVEKLGPCTMTPEVSNLILDVRMTNRQYRRSGELVGLVAESTTYCADERVMSARGEWIFVPKKMYERLRRRGAETNGNGNGHGRPAPQIPIAPEKVGRTRLQNVVITAMTQREADVLEAFVVVDANHPYFFEHKLDHVSGMLLLEACNQVGIAAAARLCGFTPQDVVFRCFDANFHSFAALEEPIKLMACVQREAGEPFASCALALDVFLTQGGEPLAECRIGMTPQVALPAMLAAQARIMAEASARDA